MKVKRKMRENGFSWQTEMKNLFSMATEMKNLV